MVPQACEVGLGTCWIGAFDEHQVKEILNIPGHVRVAAMSPLGYPAHEIPPRPRKIIGGNCLPGGVRIRFCEHSAIGFADEERAEAEGGASTLSGGGKYFTFRKYYIRRVKQQKRRGRHKFQGSCFQRAHFSGVGFESG
jgi:hypothetical protein